MPIKESYEKALRRAVESAPYYQLLQISLEQIDTGFGRFRLPFRKEVTQPYGMVHGGAIASLTDTAVAIASMTLIEPGERVTTAEFKINFFTAVTSRELTGEARVVYTGKRLIVAEMEGKNEEGIVQAKGMATYSIIPARNTAGR